MTEPIKVPLASPLGMLCKRLYPGYRGRLPVRVYAQEHVHVDGYWQGGSRTYTTFTNLAGSVVYTADQLMPADARQQVGNPYGVALGHVPLVAGVLAVEHHISCGKDRGFTVIVHPADMPKLLPAGESVVS
jgi:hypothetical protein